MPDVEIRQPVPLRTVPGVQLAAVGTWAASTGVLTLTPEDFADAVAALECPGVRNPVIKLGHLEEDSTSGIRWDGEPALGWISNMHVDGAKLVGDYTGMPEWLTKVDDNGMSVLASAYPDRSIEIYQPFVCQIGHTHPAVISAVALLGVSRPGVGVLKSIQDVYAAYTEPLSSDLSKADLSARIMVRVALAAPRDPTDVETTATTDLDKLATQRDDALATLLEQWPDVATAQQAELSAQIKTAVDDDDASALGALAVTTAAATPLILAAMTAVAALALTEQVGEAARQGVTVTAPEPDSAVLETLASGISAGMALSTAAMAGRTAAQLLGTGDGAAIAEKTVADLSALGDRFLKDQLGGALSAAQAEGRLAVLRIAPEGKYYASERNDADACKACKAIDQTQFGSLAEAEAAYGSGKYVGCLGRARCRGQLVTVWEATPEKASAHISTTIRMSIGDTMPTAALKASVSVEDISRQYYESAGYSMWITAMHVDPLELITSDDSTGKFFRVPVTLSGETFTFGDPQEVAIVYEDVKAAASALPYRWQDRKTALAAAGLKDAPVSVDHDSIEAVGTKSPLKIVRTDGGPDETPAGIAPDVTPAGAAIRQMAATTATKTPDADVVPVQPNPTEEASVDAAKIREALGLPATASDAEVAAAFAGAVPAVPETASSDDLGAMAALAASGQAVLVDKAQLATLIETAKKGELAYNQNRKNERDSVLKEAVREGRIPPASLTAYEILWDKDPEGTRKTISLLSKNIIPTASVGFLGAELDTNEADAAYEAVYGKGN